MLEQILNTALFSVWDLPVDKFTIISPVQGDAYWEAERRICASWLRHTSLPETSVFLEEVHDASEAKSFDYRVCLTCFAQASDSIYIAHI